jgi:hypothetical protein
VESQAGDDNHVQRGDGKRLGLAVVLILGEDRYALALEHHPRLIQDLREVFEKNEATRGCIVRLPQSGQAAPLSCSPMVCLTETSLRQWSQKYS